MRIAWSTDPHLHFAQLTSWERWMDQLAAADADAWLVTGDISESTDLLFQLDRMHRHAEVPIYFVLGNHDFYRGSIRSVRAQVRAHCKSRTELHYLTGQEAIDLNESWSLVGHDGWGDAMLGQFEQSPVQLADFHAIEDLARLPRPVLYERLRELGRDASETLRPSLWNALHRGRNLLVATHVPPFAEACWYEGQHSDPNWTPFFGCGAMGELLRSAAQQFPHQQILTVCGHTHHAGEVTILDNLHVSTASAEYGHPTLYRLIEL